jgi:hypothetical protein
LIEGGSYLQGDLGAEIEERIFGEEDQLGYNLLEEQIVFGVWDCCYQRIKNLSDSERMQEYEEVKER